MRVDILSTNGSSTGRSIELPKEIFEAEISEHSVYLAVKQYLAAQRQGTHKAKEKAEVNKSTRKIKRQKGTGTARAGSMKNPLFKGGGRMFGPRPRNYGFKLNKKVKAVAKVSALTSLAQEGCIKVIEDFSFDQPKTKDFVKIVNSINTDGGKTLIVTAGLEKNVYLSSRNLQNANVTEVKDLNIYQILNSKNVIFSESSLAKL
ncbi:MAG: 50S ribosomal protein L4 [Saprospiraceae bacterium]|nr:50S ribosomal protein L4 [Saprospiraceae bacterium]MCB9329223.1 50S ribosomal protein L4 [Lewinellaceae bacterium]HPK09679.1 50S ribosomal protein L4 [Saprospiraceae bacterium]